MRTGPAPDRKEELMTDQAAGWYRNPIDPGQRHYWDGSKRRSTPTSRPSFPLWDDKNALHDKIVKTHVVQA